MKLTKVLNAVLAAAIVVGACGINFVEGRKLGYAQGRASVPKTYVLDLKASIAANKAVWVPLNEPDGTQIYVIGPGGPGPGVVVDHSKPKAGEQPGVLLFPPDLAQEYLGEGPAIQPQADHERLDHAGTAHRLLRTPWGNLW